MHDFAGLFYYRLLKCTEKYHSPTGIKEEKEEEEEEEVEASLLTYTSTCISLYLQNNTFKHFFLFVIELKVNKY